MNASDLQYCLSLPFTSPRYFPYCSAIYIAYVPPNVVLYVGATRCLRDRLKAHNTTIRKVRDVRIAWMPLPQSLHKDTEQQLIRKLCPVLNYQYLPRDSLRIPDLQTEKINRFVRQRLIEEGLAR